MIPVDIVGNPIFTFLIFCFGAIIGSFLNVVILRLPRNQRLTGRSSCPHCHHELEPWELIPLLSYVILRGKCSSCHHPISSRYFIIEAITGLLFAAAWLLAAAHGSVIELMRWWYVIAVCIVIFAIDFEHYVILDKVVFPSIGILTLFNVALDISAHVQWWTLHSHFLGGLLSAICGALPFFALWWGSRGRWMGFGDVKLSAFLGAVLGMPYVFVALFLAVLLGTIVSVPLLVFGKKQMSSRLPFGTFLTTAALLTAWVGPAILHWYLAVLGIV